MLTSRALLPDLQRGLRAPLLTRLADRQPYRTDFGALHERTPRIVASAASEPELAHVLRVARDFGIPLSVRGSGHSFAGQSLSDGILLLTGGGAPAWRLLDDGSVEVTGGSRWGDWLPALEATGRTLPVLSNLASATAGGTLSAGGFGAGSPRAGAVIDHVSRFRLLTPDGEGHWCSAEENAELFRFARAGQGKLGVITRAVFHTVPRPALYRVRMQPLREMEELRAAARWMAERKGEVPDFFFAEIAASGGRAAFGGPVETERGTILPGPPLPESGSLHLVSPEALVDPRAPRGHAPGAPALRHLWCDYCVPVEAVELFLEEVEEGVRSGALATGLARVYLLYLAPPRAPAPAAAYDARGAEGAPRFGVGVYNTLRAEDTTALAELRAGHDALLARCVALGGRPYLAGAHRIDCATEREIYGGDAVRLAALRAALDPDGLFAPAPRPEAVTPRPGG